MKRTGKKHAKKTSDVIPRITNDIEQSSVSPVLLEDFQSLIESIRVRVAVGIIQKWYCFTGKLAIASGKRFSGKNVQYTV